MRRDEKIMTAVLEFATFTVRDGHEAALIAERGEMIEALRQAFPGLLAAWLTRRDDGTWVDVILWRTRAEAELAAEHAGDVASARAWFGHLAGSGEVRHGAVVHYASFDPGLQAGELPA